MIWSIKRIEKECYIVILHLFQILYINKNQFLTSNRVKILKEKKQEWLC